MDKPTITLAMIVKNEQHVILRCLDSVKDYVDNIIIHDTGSDDGTIELVNKYIKDNGLHGYVDSVPWFNFGENRSNVLAASRNTADYTLMMDADEELVCDENPFKDIAHDTCQLIVHLGTTHFKRNFLFKNTREWKFLDPIHEYAHVDGDFLSMTLPNCYIKSHHDGARSKDPNKYLKDANLLASIEDRTPRQQFYLAQSYKDAGVTDDAMDAYLERYMQGGYEQERFWSAYMLGKLGNDVLWHVRAYEIDPRRAEPLLAIGKHYMDKGNFAAADMYLNEASDKKLPEDALFVETDVYEWRAMLEYVVCLYYLERYKFATEMNKWLLQYRDMPVHAIVQVKKNLAFCEAKLIDED